MTAAIDPDAIPGGPDAVVLDPEAVEQAAADLRTDAGRIRDAGAAVPRAWWGLAAHYEAPEAGQLLAAMDPVGRTTAGYAEDLERVAAALAAFAIDLRDVKAGFDRVRADATAFRAKIAGNLEWEFDQDLIHENNRLLSAANTATVAWQDAERRCANQIRAIDHAAPLHVSTGAADDPLAYGASHIPLDTAMPWGASVARRDHCPKAAAVQVKRAVWDGFVDDVLLASLEGLGAFVGWDAETGERSYETAEQAWNGLELLIGHDVEADERSWDIFASTWTEIGKGLVAWDMWEEDPARAVGTSVGNVALLVASGGAGVATKVGTAGKLGGALKVANAVNVVNRVLDPLEWATAGVRATAGLREVMGGLGRSVEVDLPELDVSPDVPVAVRPDGGGGDNPAPGRGTEPPMENPGFKADNSPPREAVPAPPVRELVMAEASLSVGGRHADELVPGQPDAWRGHGDTGGGGGRGDGGPGSAGGGYGGDAGPGSGAGHGTEGPPEGDRFGDGIRDSDGGEQDPSTDETLDTADEPVRSPPADWDGPTTELRRGDELYPGARTPFATTTGLDPNTCYRVEGRGNFFTDDSGTIVRAEMSYGGKGNLNWDLNRPQPNMTYVVTPDVNNPVDGFDYRHEFATDDQGRVVEAKTDNLAFGEATRSESIQGRIGKFGGEGFEGGHLFAKWFGGGPESLNLVPMQWELNRGAGKSWGNLESQWAERMVKDPPVDITDIKLSPHYPGDGKVPDAITVRWRESGKPFQWRFTQNG